jgi:hypothetical protein
MSLKNAVIHLVAAASFFVGISMCSFSVIVPAYVKTYTDNAWVLGAIPVIYSVGMSVPQIFSVYYLRRYHYKGREHRNPVKEYFILELIHRSTFIFIGLSILLFADHPVAALSLFFVFFSICNIVCGFSVPVWIDMLSVTIPDNVRTMFMSLRELVGRSVGILASLTVAMILSAAAFREITAGFFLSPEYSSLPVLCPF